MSSVSPENFGTGTRFGPAPKVSGPASVEWHLILDNELDMLTAKESTVFGAIGFTAAGAALGAFPQAVSSYNKLGTAEFDGSTLVACLIFAVGIAVAMACLCASYFASTKAISLSRKIRERGSRPPAA